MLAPRVIQDCGREKPLAMGEDYDLPDVVASALVATGVAQRVRRAPENAMVPGAPETKRQPPRGERR